MSLVIEFSGEPLRAGFLSAAKAAAVCGRDCDQEVQCVYAIIRTGGKQYKVETGDEILVEKLDLEDGSEVSFEVLMLCDGESVTVGKPVVEGILAKGEVVGQAKGKKLIVFKYKPKKNSPKKQGHRQPYTKVRINAIG